MMLVENYLRNNTEVGDHHNVVCFNICGHLGVGLGFGYAVKQKLTGACQGVWDSSQYGVFQYSWLFLLTNKRNYANKAFLGQIGMLYLTVLGVGSTSKNFVGCKLTKTC